MTRPCWEGSSVVTAPDPREWDRLSPAEASRVILALWRDGRAHLLVREARDAAEFGGGGEPGE